MKTEIKSLLIFSALLFCICHSYAQDTWTKKADFGGLARYGAVGFSIGGDGYIGTGYSDSTALNDFWSYDPDSNTWVQKSAFPGTPRGLAAGFSIGNKGYITTGINFQPAGTDFWRYNPDSNIWTKKADFGGAARYGAVGFSVGGNGYVALGKKAGPGCFDDVWEYDQANNKWTQKANFPGGARYGAACFVIGNKAYVGTGIDSAGFYHNDLWEYNPSTDKWTKKSDFDTINRYDAIGFSIKSYGYIGLGFPGTGHKSLYDLWQYDTASDQWTQMTNVDTSFNGGVSVSFSLGEYGYVGTGISLSVPQNLSKSLWQYQDHTSGIKEPSNQVIFSIFPNPNTGNFVLSSSYPVQSYTICDMSGKEIYRNEVNQAGNDINVDLNLAKGMYLIRVVSSEGTAVKKFLVGE